MPNLALFDFDGTIAFSGTWMPFVVVVSASIDVYLADWCAQAGLDLICTEFDGFVLSN